MFNWSEISGFVGENTMTQVAQVERILEGNLAEILVERASACGENCATCSMGGAKGRIVRAKAENTIGAKPGDRVVVSSKSSQILGAAFAVYLLPLILLFVSYGIAAAFALEEATCMWISLGGFLLGLGATALWSRRRKYRVSFSITAYA